MGTSYSAFRNAVSTGNEREAYTLYYGKKTVRDGLQPNMSLGDHYGENTLLHFTAVYGMRRLYVDLVEKHGGRPDEKNKRRRNCLHLICIGGPRQLINSRDDTMRVEMLRYTLESGLGGMDIVHVLEQKDLDGNTALHLAAIAGLENCINVLVDAGADLFLTNNKEETAADCAMKYRHKPIATKLETKMVFSPQDDHTVSVEPDPSLLREIAEAPTGMKDKDIRSMKDQLLIETAELLGVSLFTAEALLRNHGWSKEQLLEAWMDNPHDCCEKAGVQMPTQLTVDNMDQPTALVAREGGRQGEEGEEGECEICTLLCVQAVGAPCGHTFCRDCWQQYLHSKIESGEAHNISCPAYGCYKLVPVEVIEAIVSREMAEKYLHFDIKAFVDSNPTIRWCPHPGCGQAVSLAPWEDTLPLSPPPLSERKAIARTVHCGNDHYFCWACGGEAHEPCDCDQWKQWLAHIEEMKTKVGDTTAAEADEAASNKWLATRSKPCPKCRSPIERTEGCNHMCCRKCRHDFCWVCLDEWKYHNSSTGGYFECNRYDAKKKAQEMLNKRHDQVMTGIDEIEKASRFLHYYERYRGHKESLALEEPLLHQARYKMVELAKSVQTLEKHRGSLSASALDMSFIEEAVRELLQARTVLKASYGFGYYIQGNRARRTFENMQGALEQATEMLAQAVARPHLRKPRSEIIRLTRETREKRIKLVKDIKATLPDPTPPSVRRRRRLRFHDDSSDSTSDLDPPEDMLMRLLEDLRLGWRREERSHDSPVGSPDSPVGSPDVPVRSPDGPVRSHDSQEDLLRAMELSRQEFEEESQLNADIELAKMLSTQEMQVSQMENDLERMEEERRGRKRRHQTAPGIPDLDFLWLGGSSASEQGATPYGHSSKPPLPPAPPSQRAKTHSWQLENGPVLEPWGTSQLVPTTQAAQECTSHGELRVPTHEPSHVVPGRTLLGQCTSQRRDRSRHEKNSAERPGLSLSSRQRSAPVLCTEGGLQEPSRPLSQHQQVDNKAAEKRGGGGGRKREMVILPSLPGNLCSLTNAWEASGVSTPSSNGAPVGYSEEGSLAFPDERGHLESLGFTDERGHLESLGFPDERVHFGLGFADEQGHLGPVYGEEEDLRRAIAMSLQENQPPGATAGTSGATNMDITGPQFEDSNRLDSETLPPLSNLPPELRHLMDTSRTGTHV